MPTLEFLAASAAYVHIPFCRRRCFYCDFPISVVGDRPPLSRSQSAASDQATAGYGTIAEYVAHLCEEIAATPSQNQPLSSIFLGGGTPSLLTPPQLEQILTALDRQYGIASPAEISMEIDPATFDLPQLQAYRSAGVNRVSLGVQAFQTELLQACGRTHTAADVEQAVRWVRQAGITNFSLDLISGLPHQTLDHWQTSIDRAIELAPTHLSVYDLTVETGTAFDRWYQAGSAPLPTDEATAEMYRWAQQRLTANGYQHYEISNYARPGYQCRHNRVYWENRSFYGFGMGATSYLNGERLMRPRNRREYYQWLQQLRSQSAPLPAQKQTEKTAAKCNKSLASETIIDVLLDTLMLGLRLQEGLSLKSIQESFGSAILQHILDCVQPYHAQGWIEIRDQAGPQVALPIDLTASSPALPLSARLCLSDPDGFLFSNVILSTLFKELPEAFEKSQ